MISTEFLLTSLVVVLIPGTGVIYTVSTGLFLGRRASVAAAVGCTAGILPHLTACVLGLSAVLHLSAMAFQTIKFFGVVYLLYLAWTMCRNTGAMSLAAPGGKNDSFPIFLQGILLNILNPKLTLFFVAFLPLFITPDAASSSLYQMLTLSGVFMGMTLGIFVLYGVLAGSVSAYLVRSPRLIRWLQRSFAAAFAILAMKLATHDQ